jgi:hypothetical protein
MKKAKFKVDIYEQNVIVIVLENVQKLDDYYRKLRKTLKYPNDEDEGLAQGLVLSKGFNTYLLLSEDKICVNLICHEATHVCYSILDMNNISLDESEETVALLNGFINEKIFKALQKLNYEIKF